MKALFLLISLFIIGSVNAEQNIFNVLIQDTNLVKDVRSEGDNVWIKLATVNLADDIIIRISSKDKDLCRPWFNPEKWLIE